MVAMKSPMHSCVRDFQHRLNGLFREFILGFAAHELGMRQLVNSPDMSVSILLSGDAYSEPIFAKELVEKQSAVQRGIAELFQSKAIAMWGDLLSDLYRECVRQHLEGTKNYDILAPRKVAFDFKSPEGLAEQLLVTLVSDFAFLDYKSRYKELVKLFSLGGYGRQASIISKHVEIRNAFQHHGGVLHAGGLRNLGLAKLVLKGDDGADFDLCVGDVIFLSSVEIDVLKSTLFEVASALVVYLEEN